MSAADPGNLCLAFRTPFGGEVELSVPRGMFAPHAEELARLSAENYLALPPRPGRHLNPTFLVMRVPSATALLWCQHPHPPGIAISAGPNELMPLDVVAAAAAVGEPVAVALAQWCRYRPKKAARIARQIRLEMRAARTRTGSGPSSPYCLDQAENMHFPESLS